MQKVRHGQTEKRVMSNKRNGKLSLHRVTLILVNTKGSFEHACVCLIFVGISAYAELCIVHLVLVIGAMAVKLKSLSSLKQNA